MLEHEYENWRKIFIDSLDRTDKLLSDTKVVTHANWMLVVNTGVLLWFVGMADKFTVNNKLMFKWWFILTVLSLLVSEIILYSLRILCFRLIVELQMLKAEHLKAKSLDQLDINAIDKRYNGLSQFMPSGRKCAIADTSFLVGVISMIGYIVVYFILYK